MARATHGQLTAFSRSMFELYETASLGTLGPDFTRIMRDVVRSDFEVLSWIEGYAHPKVYCEREHPPMEIYNAYWRQHPTVPLYEEFMRTRNPALRVARWSDFLSLRQFRETGLYREFYRLVETNYQVLLICPGSGGGSPNLTLSFQRQHRDFTNEDKLLLQLAAPHMERIYTQSILRDRIERAVTPSATSEVGVMVVSAESGDVLHCSARARRLCEEHLAGESPKDAAAAILREANVRDSRSFIGARFVVECRGPVRWKPGEGGEAVWLLEIVETPTAQRMPALARKGLTPRETEVLGWIAEGKTNEEIAIILGAKAGTIRKHVENILRKLGVENRTAAAAMARGGFVN